mgnify:CR=1 FL=1
MPAGGRRRPGLDAAGRSGVDAMFASKKAKLVAIFSPEHGFRGNADDYYDPRNSFLNDVLDRRLRLAVSGFLGLPHSLHDLRRSAGGHHRNLVADIDAGIAAIRDELDF